MNVTTIRLPCESSNNASQVTNAMVRQVNWMGHDTVSRSPSVVHAHAVMATIPCRMPTIAVVGTVGCRREPVQESLVTNHGDGV